MSDKCCFCEHGEWGKFAHLGCLIKAAARPQFTRDEIRAFPYPWNNPTGGKGEIRLARGRH